jgi:inorganic pyrophosphatase
VYYPTDYGFLPETAGEDGDHLDLLVLSQEPALPGSIQPVRPVGMLEMSDQKGRDVKILAVPVGDARFDQVLDLDDVPPHWKLEIETFFRTYKLLDRKRSASVQGWRPAKSAWTAIGKARKAYRRKHGGQAH